MPLGYNACTMQRNMTIFLVVIALMVALIGVGLVLSVRAVTQPISAVNSNLATQVASILNPTPTVLPDPITLIHEVRALSRLETMQYTLEKVITAEVGQGALDFLFGDQLLLIAHGEVIAGVDLEKIGADDITVEEDGRVVIVLPRAEIFIAALDNEKTYVYDRDIGLLRKAEIGLESEARRVAQSEFEKAAMEDGILEQAQLNAENFLYRFLRSIGVQDVRFETAPIPEFAPTATPLN